MNGLIVFNSANDVVLSFYDKELEAKLWEIAINQGLLQKPQKGPPPAVDSNIILQIFSPIISSQRIMHGQFDNMYSSFQCDKNLNFVFNEFLGFIFIKISQKPVDQLQRQLGVATALAKRLYGPNLFSCQTTDEQQELLMACIDCYENRLLEQDQEQFVEIEALPRLLINCDLKKMVNATLDAALVHLMKLSYKRCHVLMFVANKFVSVASTKQALPLCASDLLFIALMLQTLQQDNKIFQRSVNVFLQGISQDPCSGCVPCVAHFSQMDKRITFVQIIEYANLHIASSLYDTFFILHKVISLQAQADADSLKPAFEDLDSFVKQSMEAFKKAKSKPEALNLILKRFYCKWENLRKMYQEFLKTYERDMLIRMESNMGNLVEDVRLLFFLSCSNNSNMVNSGQLPYVASVVEGMLLEFSEFLAVKAERNISIEAYLEDFPGLIHFIYINRSTGLMIAPDLVGNKLIKKHSLANMLQFSRRHIKTGETTLLWKDQSLHYLYALWFEDHSTGNRKLVDLKKYFLSLAGQTSFKSQSEPGLLAEEYYQHIIENCFHPAEAGKVKCYELYCIHLGLVTSTVAVEHSLRLVATIADFVGKGYF